MEVFIKGITTAMPETIITNEYFDVSTEQLQNIMFKGTIERRHIGPSEKASDLLLKAANKIIEKFNLNPQKDIEIILTNVPIGDEAFTGHGATLNYKIGAKARYVYDVHNGGCISFVTMLELAKNIMKSTGAKTALVGNAQTAAGRVFGLTDNKKKPQSAVPGDGCGMAYLVADSEGGKILESVSAAYGEFAEDMYASFPDKRKWWEPGLGAGTIEFPEGKIAKIFARGNRMVPEKVIEVCKIAGRDPKEIDLFITNQPNQMFLRNWRDALGIPKEKHFDTFSKYANMFGAAVPVNLSEAWDQGLIKPGMLVCLAGFAHAGDYAGATLIQF